MKLPQSSDVVVVGGGHAGLCAAITAAESGCSVLLLERAPRTMRGGNTRHTRNLRAAHDDALACLTDTYSAETYWQDLLRVTAGNTNEDLARLTIANSPDLIHWLLDHGVHFQPSLSGTLNLSHSNAFFLGGGCALLNTLYQSAERAGVTVIYDCHVEEVQLTNGQCTGLTIHVDGATHTLTASAYVMASGGFQANQAWMRSAWGEAADNFLIRGTPYNEGHILQSLMRQGAATTGDATQCHAVAIDARAPKFDGGIVSRLDCVPFSIVVNRLGVRFYDEGEDTWPKRYAIWGRLIAAQPEQIAYAIIDSKVIDHFMPSVFPPIQGDNIAELAHALDLPQATLEQTVVSFNASVQPGDYNPDKLDNAMTSGVEPPKSHWALPIDTPPFYAYPLRPGITFTYLGLVVDEQARVQLQDNQPCSNLYAAGEIMAGNILGEGYCAGTGMTIGGVFGRIAGEQAACHRS
jgi:tricarballylate dehydrogenase